MNYLGASTQLILELHSKTSLVQFIVNQILLQQLLQQNQSNSRYLQPQHKIEKVQNYHNNEQTSADSK